MENLELKHLEMMLEMIEDFEVLNLNLEEVYNEFVRFFDSAEGQEYKKSFLYTTENLR